MKKAFLMLLLTAFLCTAAPAQVLKADQVPAAVKQAFQAKFPAVKLVHFSLVTAFGML